MRRLTVLAAATLVAACSQAAGSLPSDSPAASPDDTLSSPGATLAVSPTAAPTPSPAKASSIAPVASKTAAGEWPCPGGDPVAGGLRLLAAVVVNVDALYLRDGPCRAGQRMEAPGLANPMKRGTFVLILGGPVAFDGYRWYPVAVDLGPNEPPTAGWVAAGTTSDNWLLAAVPACGLSTIDAIARLGPVERLACYGTRSLAFTAHQAAMPPNVGIEGPCEPNPGQPAWLVCDSYRFVNADGGPAPGPSPLRLFFDPARGIQPLGLAPVGTIGPAYQIQGHFADPAARQCTQGIGSDTLEWLEVWAICQTEFVVEALQPTS